MCSKLLIEVFIYSFYLILWYVKFWNYKFLESVGYIGHSLGTAQMFVLLSLIPEFEIFIKPFIALAPVAYLGNIDSIARLGVPLEPILRLKYKIYEQLIKNINCFKSND